MNKPQTLRSLLRSAIVKSVLVTALAGAAFFATQAVHEAVGQAGGASVMDSRPLSVGSPEWLLDQHPCWTEDEQPLAKTPGHVVAHVNGGNAVYGGRRLTGLALDQVFGGRDHGLEIVGFCK